MKKGNKKSQQQQQKQQQQQQQQQQSQYHQQSKPKTQLPSMSSTSNKFKQKLIPIIKTLLSILSFYIVCVYFDVFTFIQSPESNSSGYFSKSVWCFTFAIILYVFNYITYVVRPRPSQRITIERWYTVTPLTVWAIIIGHILGLIFMVAMLWPQHGVLSILICSIFTFMMLNILQFSPI